MYAKLPARFIIHFALFAVTSAAFGQSFNRPVPPGIFPYEFKEYSKPSAPGYYLLSPFRLQPGNSVSSGKGPLILDENGYLLWYMVSNAQSTSDFKYFPAFRRFGYIKFTGNKVWYKFLDSTLHEQDSVRNSQGINYDSHELLILRNGNYIIGGLKDSIFDLSAYTFNGTPGSDKTRAVRVQEHREPIGWIGNFPHLQVQQMKNHQDDSG